MIRVICCLILFPVLLPAQTAATDSVARRIERLSATLRFSPGIGDTLAVISSRLHFRADTMIMEHEIMEKGRAVYRARVFIPADNIDEVKLSSRVIRPGAPERLHSYVVSSKDYHQAFRSETMGAPAPEYTHVASLNTPLDEELPKLRQLAELTKRWAELMKH
ncbi:MAG: hypothetical protein KDC70_15065 [Saprospiraceae bacterium]|nr:hypothetical protein [Saprospiraceae bacterium]